LFIEDGNGCIWNQDFRIDTIFSLNISAEAVDTECNDENGRIIVDVSSDHNNQFYLNDNYSGENSTLDSLAPLGYKVMVINEYGCSDSVNVEVLPSMEPIIDLINVGYLSCLRNNNDIKVDVRSGNPPFTYFLDGNPGQSTNVFNNLDPGTHSVKVIDDENCVVEKEFFIEDFNPIEVEYDFVEPTCDQANGSILLDAVGGAGPLTVIYDEKTYAADELIDGLGKGWHTFNIVDTTDCSQTVSIELNMFCKYYVPNIFSPDNDGINDTFEIFFSAGSNPSIAEFSVYDRWGKVVAQMLDVNPLEESISWDGKVNNQDALTGVYTYILSGKFENGEEIFSQGPISLVR